MDNLAVSEDVSACPDEAEDRRADCEIHHRAYDLERDAVNEDERRVRIAVSSDVPVERAFGTEVLDHSADAIDLSFLGSGRAPLLLDHDMTRQIGVVEEVTIDGEARRTRATVRFGKSALANDVFQDVVDGIRSNVSVGYRIDDLSKEEVEDGTVFRATRWTPLEVSIVSIPADHSVGVGRSAATQTIVPEETQIMEPEVNVEEVRAEAAAEARAEYAKAISEILALSLIHI